MSDQELHDFWFWHEHDVLCEVEYCGIGRPPTPWCERFANKIVYHDDCWLWRSAIGKLDCERNRLNFSLRVDNLHNIFGCNAIDACRWIYERVIGPIPSGLQLDHLVCDNWRCVNPWHLDPVTNIENNSRYAPIRATWAKRDALGRWAGRLEVAK